MKKYWTEEAATWKNSPMAYWVHIEQDEKPWYEAETFSPPAPRPNANKMYTIYKVQWDDMVFEFSSRAQIEECIKVLNQKVLPSTQKLSSERPGNKGPNSHWLSRLPSDIMSWKDRQKIVKYLGEILLQI